MAEEKPKEQGPSNRTLLALAGAIAALVLCILFLLCNFPIPPMPPTPPAVAVVTITLPKPSTYTPTSTGTPTRPTATNTWTPTSGPTVKPAQPPRLNLPQDMIVEATGPNGAPANFTATATEGVDEALPVTCHPPSGSLFRLGSSSVTCSATGSRGITTSGSFAVIVRDTTPPKIIVPDNLVLEATSNIGAAASFSAAANDLVDSTLVPRCDRPSGSTFAIGDTTVTCSAADRSGNQGKGSFVIRVQHTGRPGLTLPRDMLLEATSPAGAPATFVVGVNDAIDKVTVTCNYPSGSTFPLGTTIVNCTGKDSHGNSSSGSFRVTVQHTIPPTIRWTTPSTSLVYYGPSKCGGMSVTINASVTDALGISSVELDYFFMQALSSFAVKVAPATPSTWQRVPMVANTPGLYSTTITLGPNPPPNMTWGMGTIDYWVIAVDGGGLTTRGPLVTDVTVKNCIAID